MSTRARLTKGDRLRQTLAIGFDLGTEPPVSPSLLSHPAQLPGADQDHFEPLANLAARWRLPVNVMLEVCSLCNVVVFPLSVGPYVLSNQADLAIRSAAGSGRLHPPITVPPLAA